MSVSLAEVKTKKEKKVFIDFPHDLYQGDPNYVPELHIAQAELLDEKKNPFFKSAEVALYLAYKNDKIVGRIAAIKNDAYNEYHSCNVGFFGFFDCIDDKEVADLLLNKAQTWNESKGHDSVLGPTNFSTNDTAGLLIDGFDSPPVVMMTYNKPYYIDHIERAGYGKEMDLFAYKIPTATVSKKSIKLSDMLIERLKRKGITIRTMNMKNFKTEVQGVRNIYNKAWANNWGFIPASKEEFDHIAEGLKMVINPEFCYLAETEAGEMVGFMLAVPNINEVLIKNKRGRLFPFGIFRLLLGKKKVKIVRVITMGVIDEYRKLGIEGIFYSLVIQAAQRNNIDFGEASWVLENNEMMNQGIKKLQGEKYKTYRIYSKSLK